MFSKELLLPFALNTIIMIIVVFILFRMQDNKIKYYFKRLDKKLNLNNTDLQMSQTTQPIQQSKQLNQIISNEISSTSINNPSDIDSYIDPINDD
jgi:hypothetical protein